MNKETFSELFRLTFAGALQEKLCNPRTVGLYPYHNDPFKALRDPQVVLSTRGKLPLSEHGEKGETVVGISVYVLPEWMARLPVVSTDAPFLRRERDWHVPVANILCYSQDAEWSWKLDELWNQEADADEIIEFAASWCIRNADSLITRHLHGHRYGIAKWPKQWGQWGHGEAGIRECDLFIQTQKAA